MILRKIVTMLSQQPNHEAFRLAVQLVLDVNTSTGCGTQELMFTSICTRMLCCPCHQLIALAVVPLYEGLDNGSH